MFKHTGSYRPNGPEIGGGDKPSAMEQMVSKMLGFTPEQMQETITGLRDTIVAVGAALKRIEDTQAAILARMEATENVGSERDDDDRGGNTGGSASDGDAGQRNRGTRRRALIGDGAGLGIGGE